MAFKQIDCFKINLGYLKLLGVWPGDNSSGYYRWYSRIFLVFFLITYYLLLSVNFFFLPRQLDVITEEMVFYFTEVVIVVKALTFYFMRDKIIDILDILESDIFQPDADDALKIVENSKQFIVKFWKISAVISYTANFNQFLTSLFAHLFLHIDLALPICSYSFIPDGVKENIVYPLYLYQSLGVHFHMLFNLNIDGFFLGLIILTTAQLEVLDYNFRRVTDYGETGSTDETEKVTRENALKKCITHFDKIDKFYNLVQEVFGVSMFVQISMSSCIICVGLFRFLLPAPNQYYIFLTCYLAAMMLQILMPCWFGSRVMETSSSLSVAAYSCDWPTQSREFKTNIRLFVERMKKPLSLTAMKIFPLSLITFTSIMRTAYSFFTLLRNMQTRES